MASSDSSSSKAPTALTIAREVFPDETEESLEYIIWNRTGWPVFWPAGFKTVGDAVRSQLKTYRRALKRLRPGRRLCDFCDRVAVPGASLCRKCAWVLDREEIE